MSAPDKAYRIFFLFLLSSIFFSTVQGAVHSCSQHIQIDADGTTHNTIKLTIESSEGYMYEDGLYWELSVPRQATNITVEDDDQTLTHLIPDKLTQIKALGFFNAHSIVHQPYPVTIKYQIPRGVILHRKTAKFDQIIPSTFCTSRNLSIQLPEDWEITESSLDYKRTGNTIRSTGPVGTSASIVFNSNETLSPVITYKEGKFNVSVPEKYSEFTKSQIEEVNSYLSDIEATLGIKTPSQFQINYVVSHALNEIAGKQYGGVIEIMAKQLSKQRLVSLETLLHEIIHSYNKRMYNGTDWWWEEGTANYVAHKILAENGYTLSGFTPSEEILDATFTNCEFSRSFINDWNPVRSDTEFQPILLDPCNTLDPSSEEDEKGFSYITDKDTLGYRYSEWIISEIFQNSTAGLGDFYRLMQSKNVTLINWQENNHQLNRRKIHLNNQINYFASKALDEDLTSFLKSNGLNTESWEEQEQLIIDGENTLAEINESNSFNIFTNYFQQLEDVKRKFYRGRFSAAENVDTIVDNAQNTENRVSNIVAKIEDARSHIRELAQPYNPSLYSDQFDRLNTTVELIQNGELQRAETHLQRIKTDSNNRAERIQEHRQNLEKTNTEINSSDALLPLFSLGSEEKIERSRQEFSSGDLEESAESLNSAKFRVTASKIITIAIYLILLCLAGYGGYKRFVNN